jgi:hypothetical protein
MPGEGEALGASFCIPDFQCVVTGGRDDEATIGADRASLHNIRMPGEGEALGAGFCVPDFQRVVTGGRDDEATIRADRAASHRIRMPGEGETRVPHARQATPEPGKLGAGFCVPDFQRVVPGGRDDEATIRADRAASHNIRMPGEGEALGAGFCVPDFQRVVT